ncbi:putative NAD dependent epimerase/dehydratase [Aspergillus venezuelensis]
MDRLFKIGLILGSYSGFVASHVVDHFLRTRYIGRGTVRSASTVEKVLLPFRHYLARLSVVIVDDVARPGAFDTAVKDVHAIDGTVNVLKATHQLAPKVKRVVLTSSFAAMVDMSKGNWPGHVYSKADWNPTPYEAASAPGAPAALAYSTAKALAERAAWDFVKNESSDRVPDNMFWYFVDVREVAQAHLSAYETPVAGNERFFICKGNFTYQLSVDALRSNITEIKDRMPAGNHGSGAVPEDVYTVDTLKSRDILGLTYRSLEETIVDTAKVFLELEANKSK